MIASVPFKMKMGGMSPPVSLFLKSRHYRSTSLDFLKIETCPDKNLGNDSFRVWKLLPWPKGDLMRGRPVIDDPIALGSSFDITVVSYKTMTEFVFPEYEINMKLIGDADILMMLKLTYGGQSE